MNNFSVTREARVELLRDTIKCLTKELMITYRIIARQDKRIQSLRKKRSKKKKYMGG